MEINTKHIVIFVICFLLSFVVTVQVKTVNKNNADILRLKRENELRDEINQWKDAYNNLASKNSELNKKIDQYREAAISDTDNGELLKSELDEANIIAGLTAVKGKGIKINIDVEKVLEEIALNAGKYDSSVSLIQDYDIMEIVNELVMYGAEAISVNGQRITNLTSIKSSGPIIKINGVNTTAPFVIEAIGDPDTLEASIALKDGKVDELRNLKIDITITKEDIKLRGYEGTTSLRYATPVEKGGK